MTRAFGDFKRAMDFHQFGGPCNNQLLLTLPPTIKAEDGIDLEDESFPFGEAVTHFLHFLNSVTLSASPKPLRTP